MEFDFGRGVWAPTAPGVVPVHNFYCCIYRMREYFHRLLLLTLILFPTIGPIGTAQIRSSLPDPTSADPLLRSITNANELPSRITEQDLGLLPEDPDDQPEFLPLTSDKHGGATTLTDTTSYGQWDPRFGLPGISGTVQTTATVSNETYVGGTFLMAGGVVVNNIAMWDGNSWHALGYGVDATVYTIAINGDDVYIGGSFVDASGVAANKIAVWNRLTKRWSALGEGVGGHSLAYVAAIATDGNDIYVGGRFLTAGKVVAVNIARWSSGRWSRVGGGANGYVFSLAIDGNDLYVGGRFTVADDKPIRRIARVDRTTNTWTELGGGVQAGAGGYISAIAVDGNGIYAAGMFGTAGRANITARGIAHYDAAADDWSGMGLGLTQQLGPADVYTLLVQGDKLYVGGRFDAVDTFSTRAYNIARWNRTAGSWDLLLRQPSGQGTIASGVLNISANFPYRNFESAFIATIRPNGSGSVVVGGSFNLAGPNFEKVGINAGIYPNSESVHPLNICLFDGGSKWSIFGSGVGGPVNALAAVGDDVFLGGAFNTVGSMNVKNLARWNNATGTWNAVGNGIDGTIRAMAADANALYVGGAFKTIDGTTVDNIARWDRSSGQWFPLGSSPFAGNTQINVLVLHGNTLYAGGANGAFAWNGSSWSPLGSNVDGPVYAIAVDGDRVYVGGKFSTAGGIAAASLAVWIPATQQWAAVGNGVGGQVNALALDGDNLYVAGKFSTAGGIEALNVALYRIEAETWEPLDEGITGTLNALAVLNGSLFAAGAFPRVGIFSMNSIARWDGREWFDVDRGVLDKDGEGTIYALATGGGALYAGGDFVRTGGTASYNFGRWTNRFTSDAPTITAVAISTAQLRIAPNPIGSQASIRIRLATSADIRLSVHDATGRELEVVTQHRMDEGDHTIQWHAERLPQGTYFCRLRANGSVTTQVVTITR